MIPELTVLRDAEVLSPLDLHFAATLERLYPGQPSGVLLGAAFASRAVAQGHVCADLRRIVGRPILSAAGEAVPVALPPIFEWVMQLGASPLCGGAHESTPLVFDGEARLYLRRYWEYQERVAADLRARAEAIAAPLDTHTADRLCAGIERLFRSTAAQTSDPRQRLAALGAVRHNLCVISGGPGTGKTTTVVRILALLIEEALELGLPPPRMMLLAPTGKAAARLSESIQAGRAKLDCRDVVRNAIELEAATIHRRLGVRPGHPTRFFHDRAHPLSADIVLVDEASMVDLALMAKLLDAVPPAARLVLLGDKDQLASVEAGALLGDICHVSADRSYSAVFGAEIERVLGPEVAAAVPMGRSTPGIWDCVVELTHSFRFREDGGIGRLAKAINLGHAQEAAAQVESQSDPQVSLVHLVRPEALVPKLRDVVLPALRPMLSAREPDERLARLGDFRLLAAHRRGAFGTEHLNRLIEELLRTHGLLSARGTASTPWYDGRPIIVTQNDYQLDLFNGDVGILHGGSHGEVYAYFVGTQGELRKFLPARLPPHESVFAMTVHKAQGSEFREVGLLMPPQLSPLLTRELVYTGVTRAKERVTVFGSAEVLRDAVARRIDRASGLSEALWHGG